MGAGGVRVLRLVQGDPLACSGCCCGCGLWLDRERRVKDRAGGVRRDEDLGVRCCGCGCCLIEEDGVL